MGRSALMVAVLVVAVFSAGSASPAPARHGWTRSGLGAVSQPAPAGQVFLFYAHRGHALEVVALQATNGSTAWVAPASASNVTAGVNAELAVAQGLVYYLATAGSSGLARVVARETASGKQLWRSPAGYFATWPEICPGEAGAVCVTGDLPGAGSGELRLAVATGRLIGSTTVGTGGGREVGPGLFDTGARPNERLLATTASGRIAWQRRLSAIFTLPHASTDGGWNLDRVGSLFVGSVGVEPPTTKGKFTIDLAKIGMTAGFTIAAGQVVWREPGFFSCDPLPCPGAAAAGYSSAADAAPSGLSVGVLMTGHGRVTGSIGHPPRTLPRGVSFALRGFSPSTGRTLWTFSAGRDMSLYEGATPPLIASSTIVLKRPSGGYVALDLRTGHARRVAAGTRGWCRDEIEYEVTGAYYNGRAGQYDGQLALFPCTVDARRANLPARVPALVKSIGATTAGMTAWTDTDAVRAVPA